MYLSVPNFCEALYNNLFNHSLYCSTLIISDFLTKVCAHFLFPLDRFLDVVLLSLMCAYVHSKVVLILFR